MEVADFGIRVNAVAPGAMDTDMLTELLEAGPEAAGNAEYEQGLRRRNQGGDLPEKAAELIVFLLSPDSAGISGRLLSAVWDPWTDLSRFREELRGTDIYTLRRITPEDRGYNWGEGRAKP
jgi:NAD(P)-dependent dehydrogenase (short-subunit alcohol dehydrogenase family)